MNSNLKKRILTSILLISLLIGMFFYSYIMIVSLIIIAIISWIEFYAMLSKILKKNILKKISIQKSEYKILVCARTNITYQNILKKLVSLNISKKNT